MKNTYVFINNNIFPSLLAESAQEQEQGLMFIEPPAPIMTFAYNTPRVNKFWMKNTKAPLDIIFCCNGKVIDICYGEPFSTKILGPDKSSDLVIEVPSGTAAIADIKIGHLAGLISNI